MAAHEGLALLDRSEKLADELLACADTQSALDLLLGRARDCFWDDDERLLERWNGEVARPVGWPGLTLDFSDPPVLRRLGQRRGGLVLAGWGDRDDGLRLIHATARATRPSLGWRFCRDSEGQSEKAFIALPPAVWHALEARHGLGRVRARLLRLPARFEDFMAKAFEAPVVKGALAPELTDWVGGRSYQPAKLSYVNLDVGDGTWHLDRLVELADRYLDSGPQLVAAKATSYLGSGGVAEAAAASITVDRRELPGLLLPYIGGRQIRVASVSLNAFLVIEANGVAAGWRTDTGSSA